LNERRKEVEELRQEIGEEKDPQFQDMLQQEEEKLKAEEAAEAERKKSEVLIEETEKPSGQESKHEFQAETRKLLDIVARSIYSEREVRSLFFFP
jgi:TNF receptor-associated protein 1